MPIGDNDSAIAVCRVHVVVMDVQSGVTLSVELATETGRLVPEVFCEQKSVRSVSEATHRRGDVCRLVEEWWWEWMRCREVAG